MSCNIIQSQDTHANINNLRNQKIQSNIINTSKANIPIRCDNEGSDTV